MKIRTNHQPRPILHPWDLQPDDLREFDYIVPHEGRTWMEQEKDWMDSGAQFFRYRGQLYDLGEFVRIVPPGQAGGGFAHYDHTGDLVGWDGIATDSYFSGTVVKLVDDGDSVIVGLLTC